MILAGAGVSLYGLRKLDVISDALSYFLGTLAVCVILIIHPAFDGSQARVYANDILALMVELLRAVVELVKSWASLTAPLGGVI